MPMCSDTNRDKACWFIKKYGLWHADMAMVSSGLTSGLVQCSEMLMTHFASDMTLSFATI